MMMMMMMIRTALSLYFVFLTFASSSLFIVHHQHHHHHDNKKSPVDHILPGPNLHIVSHLFNSFFLLCFETRNMFFSFSITSSWDTIVGNILSCEKLYANHKPQMDGFSPLFPGKRRQQDFLEVSVDMAFKVKLKLKMQMP